MSPMHSQRQFALALLARLVNGYPEAEPSAASFGVDPFSSAAVKLMVHRLYEAHVLAKARAMAAGSAHGANPIRGSTDGPSTLWVEPFCGDMVDTFFGRNPLLPHPFAD